MAAPLIIPDHIKQARLAALCAGIACSTDDPATVALMLAAVAYNRIPQVNKAEMLRQEYVKAQQELEKTVSDLLAERQKNQRLLDELQSMRSTSTAQDKQQILDLRSEVVSLRYVLQGGELQARYKAMRSRARGLCTHLNKIRQAAENGAMTAEARLLSISKFAQSALEATDEQLESA